MLEPVHAIHASQTRLRLRVPGRRRDAAWFAAVERVLATQPGISAVRASPATATLTLHLDAGNGAAGPAVSTQLATAGLRLADQQRAVPTPVQRPAPAARPLRLRGVRLRRRDLALALFLLLLIRQMLRSGWLAPALALAWLLAETLPGRRR
jgi:hypothetical protein